MCSARCEPTAPENIACPRDAPPSPHQLLSGLSCVHHNKVTGCSLPAQGRCPHVRGYEVCHKLLVSPAPHPSPLTHLQHALHVTFFTTNAAEEPFPLPLQPPPLLEPSLSFPPNTSSALHRREAQPRTRPHGDTRAAGSRLRLQKVPR